MGLSFPSASQVSAKLKQLADRFPDRVAAAIYKEAQIEMTESKRRCPVADPSWYIEQGYGKYPGTPGTLRASGTVEEPEREGRNISVTLSYGGAASDYAIIVHENLEAHHPIGQAKYLESVLNESRSHMAARIAQRVHFDKKGE